MVSIEKAFNDANGKNGMHICIIGAPVVVGPRNPMFDSLMKGDPYPMLESSASFLSIENFTFAVTNAEEKLNARDCTKNKLAGRKLYLKGEAMSYKAILSLPSWHKNIHGLSPFVFRAIIKINMMCASLFNWTSFGPDCTTFLLDIMKSQNCDVISEEAVQESYAAIDMGPLNPPIVEYIKQIVEKHNAKELMVATC